jgi:hypothetical protein
VLVDEQHVVFEARIQVRLEAQLNDDGIVVAVDVSIDSVQTLEHVPDEGGESLGKWHTDATWEHLLIVDVGLHPRHKVFDVLRRGHLCRLLVVFGVLPEVLELIRSLHLRAALRRAEFRDGAVQQVDLVIEVDNYDNQYVCLSTKVIQTIHRQPLILIFTLWQFDRLPQTTTAQCCFGILLELPTACSPARLLRLEGPSRARVTRQGRT